MSDISSSESDLNVNETEQQALNMEDEEIEDGVITRDQTTLELQTTWEADSFQLKIGSSTWKSLLIQGNVLLIFLICGGLIFWALEGKDVDSSPEPQEKLESMYTLIDNLTKIIENDNCSAQMDLLRMLRHLVNERQRQNSSVFGSSSHVWNIPGSIFFAITIVTTIGYGNVVPVTAFGRVFCCIYAIFGIPLCLVFLVNIGDKLNSSTAPLDRRLRTVRPPVARFLRTAVIFTLGTVVFMVVPSLVFCHLQDWNFGTALYFSFISLSTIGFGDYVAGINYFGPHRPVYRIMVGIWIFLGLAWLAGIVSSIQEAFQNLAKEVEAKSIFRNGKAKKSKLLLSAETDRLYSASTALQTDDISPFSYRPNRPKNRSMAVSLQIRSKLTN